MAKNSTKKTNAAKKPRKTAAVPEASPAPKFAFSTYASRFVQSPKKGVSNG